MSNKTKKKIFLFGGTGNYLFQIGHAIELSKLNFDVVLFYLPQKLSFIWKFFGFTQQEIWINTHLIAEKNKLQIEKINFIDAVNVLTRYLLKKLNFNVNFDLPLCQQSFISSKYVIGYFQSKSHQSYKTLEHLAKLISSELNISKKLYMRNVIHFRAGDFDKASYIKKDVLKHIASEHEKIIFTTNDRKKVKKYCDSIDLDYEINNSKSALDDFKFMSTSQRLYVSFSTFSFWSALICKLNGGTVIFPFNESQLKVFNKNQGLIYLFKEFCE